MNDHQLRQAIIDTGRAMRAAGALQGETISVGELDDGGLTDACVAATYVLRSDVNAAKRAASRWTLPTHRPININTRRR